jgi:hypothetical protein
LRFDSFRSKAKRANQGELTLGANRQQGQSTRSIANRHQAAPGRVCRTANWLCPRWCARAETRPLSPRWKTYVKAAPPACALAPVLGRCLSPLSVPRVSWRALSAEQPGRLLPAKAAGRTGAQPPGHRAAAPPAAARCCLDADAARPLRCRPGAGNDASRDAKDFPWSSDPHARVRGRRWLGSQSWGMYLLAAFIVLLIFVPVYKAYVDPTVYGAKKKKSKMSGESVKKAMKKA